MARELTKAELRKRVYARLDRGRGAANNPDMGEFSEGAVNDDPEYNAKRTKEFRKRADAKASKGAKNAREMNANARQRTLRSLVSKASDIGKLAKSDIRTINSLATSAANEYKDTTSKDAIQKALKATPAPKGLLSVVARSAGILGAAVTMNEFRKVHKQITDNPTKKYGGQTLFKILTKD
tara:strand:- start:8191 stop:8733 length:543 start_codon:yes stop_codon:yes gene_type:complete